MKILIAIERGGNPLWNRNEYDLVMFDDWKKTSEVITWKVLPEREKYKDDAFEFYFTDKGVEARYFACGSGYGKAPISEQMLAIPPSDYDKLVIIESEEKREHERNYDGNWRDNSDFEPGGKMEQTAKAEREPEVLPPNVVERFDYVGITMDSTIDEEKDLTFERKLKVPVTAVRWNYPSEVERGSYNVYSIDTAQTFGELLTRIIEVFQQEYAKHEKELPHALGDYIIEQMEIHPNNLATVQFGS